MVMGGVSPAELMVGDPAPKLQTGGWIQGAPVSGFDSNHVYIVEFWATWCGPCIDSIPQLNQLSKKFEDKGVIVIGQDVDDSDKKVAPFVKKMGTNMTYRVALDDKRSDTNGFMNDTWWKRGVNGHGIPTVFIINRDGVIAWIDHPINLKAGILDEILSGQQDLARARIEYGKDFDLNTKYQELQITLISALKDKKWDDAQLAIHQIFILLPNMTNSYKIQQLKIFLGQKNFAGAFQLADSLDKSHPDSDYWQNALAWAIATSELPDQQCLTLAETLATRAVQSTKGANSGPLDTLARVQFMLGKKSEAIATEEKAVSVDHNPRQIEAWQKTIASYRDGKLPDFDSR